MNTTMWCTWCVRSKANTDPLLRFVQVCIRNLFMIVPFSHAMYACSHPHMGCKVLTMGYGVANNDARSSEPTIHCDNIQLD